MPSLPIKKIEVYMQPASVPQGHSNPWVFNADGGHMTMDVDEGELVIIKRSFTQNTYLSTIKKSDIVRIDTQTEREYK